MNKIRKITTKIKFAPHSETGQVVGFVSKVGNNWRGVRESTPVKKIIVVLDAELAKRIRNEIVYECELIPMKEKIGYIAVSAIPLRYTAKVEMCMLSDTFKIYIKFGSKTILYSPSNKKEKYSNPELIIDHLITMEDQINNLNDTIEEFRKAIKVMSANYVR